MVEFDRDPLGRSREVDDGNLHEVAPYPGALCRSAGLMNPVVIIELCKKHLFGLSARYDESRVASAQT